MLKLKKNQRKLGILTLDRHYHLVERNTARKDTYNFPVCIKRIHGLYNPPSPPIYKSDGELTDEAKMFIKAALELEASGVSAIVSSCGFFSLMQPEVSKFLSVPVHTSPLLLIPFVQALLPAKKKIGLLTLFREYLTSEYFTPIRHIDMKRIVISDMRKAIEFRRMIDEDSRDVNEKVLEEEIVNAAKSLANSVPDIGAIVIECSDMTPYSERIRQQTGLPVYDYRTLAEIAYYSSILFEEVK